MSNGDHTPSARRRRHVSTPSIPGSITSSTIAPYSVAPAIHSASSPVAATSTLSPRSRMPRRMMPASLASSSTISTRTALSLPRSREATMTISHDGPIVAGTAITVKLSGHAEWNRPPTDEFETPYDLWLYAQNPDVVPQCEGSYGRQLSAGININLKP